VNSTWRAILSHDQPESRDQSAFPGLWRQRIFYTQFHYARRIAVSAVQGDHRPQRLRGIGRPGD
jgi:hypothetical protein